MISRLKYLLVIAKSQGWSAALKFIPLRIKAGVKARDTSFVDQLHKKQDALFDLIGVPVEKAVARAEKVEAGIGLAPDEVYSQRLNALGFAALFESGFRPKNILELGTNTGVTSSFLADLFPDAKVYTINLTKDDPSFASWHEGEEAYLESRLRLEKRSNVIPIRANTLELMNLNLPDFDLIWVDAGHEYPEVAWDHFYCISKLRPGGWLFTDDVVLLDNVYFSHYKPAFDVIKVINYFNDRIKNKIVLYPKRREVDQFVIFGKYIGVMHKLATSKK